LTLLNKITKFLLTIAATVFVAHTATAQMEFVENKGQWDSKVNFRGDFSTGSFFLENKGFTVTLHKPEDLQKLSEVQHGHANNSTNTSFLNKTVAPTAASRPPLNNNNEPSVTVHSHAYKVNFLGSSNNIQVVPDKAVATHNNYLLGNDKSKWASNCKVYQAVTYKNVYPDIDVRYYTESGNLKYDLIVRPGGNPNAIAMRYDGVDKLEVKNKELIIGTSVGSIKELYPYSYQSATGKRETVECKYAVRDNIVSFKVNNYSAKETLVIDPSLIFASFTGSAADNWGYTATPGPDGSFFAGGISFGSGYQVSPGAYQTTFGGGVKDDDTNGSGYDIAIFKFSADGSQRLYATYIGGSGNEQPHSMIADELGNLIIAGRSSSPNYPSTSPQIGSGGNYDIVITKLNPNGSAIIGSVKIGGLQNDGVNIKGKYNGAGAGSTRRNYGDDARSEVILDNAGNIYLASCTQSDDFPVTPGTPIQKKFGKGLQDGVILKFNPNLSSLLFGTYFGGSGDDACFVLSINPLTGNVYVAGGTTSNDLPGNKTGVLSSSNQGGVDGFVTEIMSDGSGIIKTTYAGTSGEDLVYGVQFDKFGFPYIMGTTTGNWEVTSNVGYKAGIFPDGNHAKQFISKLQPDLSSYVYSTVFGTNSSVPNLSPTAFLVDRCQNVYVSGWGGDANSRQSYPTAGTFGLPSLNQIPGLPAQDGNDFYFFVLEKNATKQLFGSHYGQNGGFGDHVDGGTSRFDANGIIYQAMCANCGGGAAFPTTAGVWAINNGSRNCNEAAVKIEMNFAGVGASVKATINGVIDTIGCVPLNIKFIDTLAKGKKYVWNFGDVASPKNDTITFAPNNSTSHTYNQVGTYRVRLISIDSSTCNISDTAYVTVKVGNNEVKPDFSFIKLDSCNSLRYRFDNLTTAALPKYNNQTFTWDFGDGSPRVTSGFVSQIHTFPSVGSYTVTLLVDDSTFCNSPDSAQKMLRINPNVKAIFNTSTRGCVPYTPVIKNNSLGGTDWQWQFDNGTVFSTDFEPVYTFNTVGSYNVRLIATDTSTCNKVDTSGYFTITVYPIPTANFTWSPNPPIENTKTNFTNLSVGATRYLWDFGDGETSTEVNPSYQFNRTDTFNVVLLAFNDADCVDTFAARVPILIRPLLDVPNAFTPGRNSGNGYNNGIVKVEGFGIGKMSWKIYNRWGQVVFATNSLRQGWDGTFKGVLQPIDVYGYTLDVEFTDGKKLRKTGDITLLR
jgi:gliding motility-associated-like protein